MVSAIGAIGSAGSSHAVSAIRAALTSQTKVQLESLGINTSDIQTEDQGQAVLQSVQSSEQRQKSQKSQQSHQQSGSRAAFETIKQEAVTLAGKLGISVSSEDKLEDIMDAISKAISDMQAQATNDPQKAAVVAQYQAEFQALGQSMQNLESSKPSSDPGQGSIQLQASLTGLANYNVASMSISSNNTGTAAKT